jgi:hypothetical protein
MTNWPFVNQSKKNCVVRWKKMKIGFSLLEELPELVVKVHIVSLCLSTIPRRFKDTTCSNVHKAGP